MRALVLLFVSAALLVLSACQSTSPVPADQQLVLLHRQPPLYPFELRQAGITGEVEFEFFVETDGGVREVRIVRSTHPLFSEQVVAAVRLWKFQPEIKAGIPVRKRLVSSLAFSIP